MFPSACDWATAEGMRLQKQAQTELMEQFVASPSINAQTVFVSSDL